MKPYVFQFGTQPWPEGVTCLQVYAPINLTVNPELAELITRWRDTVADEPLWFVEDQWLHVTLEVITDRPGGDISQAARDEVAAALAEHLRDSPLYRGRAGSALAYESGVIVDISPAAPLIELHHKIRAAVRAVRGPAATAYRVGKPHISLGYAYAQTDSDGPQRRLRQVDPNGADLHIDTVCLVDVAVDQRTKKLRWEPVAELTLAAPSPANVGE